MEKLSTVNHYSKPIIILHWLTLILIIAVYSLMEFKGIFPKGSPGRDAMKNLHFMLGMTVFALTWLWLIFRLVSKKPPIHPPLPMWQVKLSKLVHLSLYGVLIVLPFTGWLVVSAAGGHVSFWGFELPALLSQDKTLAGNIKEVHETIANIAYGLIGLHILAALYHHYWNKDDTLRRMLP